MPMRRIRVATCRRPIAWPSRRADRAASGHRQTDGPDGARRSGASAPDPPPTPASAGSRRSTARAQELALPNDWQGMGSVDHRFALSNPALMSAPSKKSFSSASCPILAWRTLRSGVSDVGFVPPNTSAARASNCCFHSVIWVGWTLKLLGQLGQRLVAFDRRQGHLRLEGGPVIASRSLHRLAPLVRHLLVAFGEARLPLSTLSEFPEPPLTARAMMPQCLIPADPQYLRGARHVTSPQHVDGQALEEQREPRPPSAHGTRTCTTPCSPQSTRGMRACR